MITLRKIFVMRILLCPLGEKIYIFLSAHLKDNFAGDDFGLKVN